MSHCHRFSKSEVSVLAASAIVVLAFAAILAGMKLSQADPDSSFGQAQNAPRPPQVDGSEGNRAASNSSAAQEFCPVPYEKLESAIKKSVKPSGGPSNGGFDNNEWAVIVQRNGTICAVASSGDKPDAQWLGSRPIAVEKASTANAFSLKEVGISTANLYAGAQPGGILYGIITSSILAPSALAAGEMNQYGTAEDPLVGKRAGGVIVFGGGLGLYDGNDIIGALGVSGDTSCADHNVAWRVRHSLGLDKVPRGVTPNQKDAIIYDIGRDGKSQSGFGHVKCAGKEAAIGTDIGAAVVPRAAP